MLSKSLNRWTAVWLALLALALSFSVARAADGTPPPPYMVHVPEYVAVFVTFDEAKVRKLVPPELKLSPGATGRVVVYTGESPGQLGHYTTGYISIDVEGHDSPSGGKAQFMLAGLYGPSDAATEAVAAMGFPVRNGTSRLIATAAGRQGVASHNGSDLYTLEVRTKADPCPVVGGVAHYINRRDGGGLQLTAIPFTTQFCAADPGAVSISAPASDAIGKIGPVKPVGAAIFRDLQIAFSVPVALR